MLPLLARTARAGARSHAAEQAVLARGFAAKATAPQQQQAPAAAPAAMAGGPKLPAPPLQLSGTLGSVASLTWQIAMKENMQERVQEELAQLAEAMTQLPELRLLSTDPFVPTVVRKKVFQRLLEDGPQVKVSEVTKRLLDSLADENALTALPTVSKIYEELVLAQKKEVYVTIVTAKPLDKMEQTEIRKQAEKFVEPGFKLVTKTKVDRKLQGGFVLEFEDRLVDVSTSKKASEFDAFVKKLENDLS